MTREEYQAAETKIAKAKLTVAQQDLERAKTARHKGNAQQMQRI